MMQGGELNHISKLNQHESIQEFMKTGQKQISKGLEHLVTRFAEIVQTL